MFVKNFAGDDAWLPGKITDITGPVFGPQALQETRPSCVNPQLISTSNILIVVCVRDSRTFYYTCALTFPIGCASPDSVYYLKAELNSLPHVAL